MKPNDTRYIAALRFIFRAWIVTVLCGPVLYWLFVMISDHHFLGLVPIVGILSPVFSLPPMFLVSLITFLINKSHTTVIIKKLVIGIALTLLLLTTYCCVSQLLTPRHAATFIDAFHVFDLLCILAYWLVAMIAIMIFKLKEPFTTNETAQ